MSSDENNSWWDRVGQPKPVETTYKSNKFAKLQNNGKYSSVMVSQLVGIFHYFWNLANFLVCLNISTDCGFPTHS